MSDTLKTNADSSEVDSDTDVDAIRFSPLFQDEEDDSSLQTPPRRRGRVWLIVISVVLLVVLIGGGIFVYMRRASSSQVSYTTIPVSIGNLTSTVSASGPLQAKAEYDMNFSTAGQISAINVHVGQQVKAGQTLATLNAPNLQIAVQEAQITVNNAQNTYNTAVADGDSTNTLNIDSNALQSAQLQLQTAQNNLAAATLKAPGNAVVASINGIVGQDTGSSSGSSTSSFMVLLDTSGFTITASVNEADIANVQINQPVRFTVTAYAGQTFRATVSSISIAGTTTSGVVSYPVTLTVNMSNIGTAHLYPGMTATATITTAQRIGALLVSNSAFTFPTTALQAGVITRNALTQGLGGTAGTGGFSGTGRGTTGAQGVGSRHVVLVLRNGKLVPVLITTGLTNGTFSEVLSGLNQGDQVVTGATGGAFANLSTGSGTNTTGGGIFRTGGGGFGGGGVGGGRSGAGG
ncbi:MAG TPA: efflux RND transporter periplasmic adaptor subunit [Ktedonobacteraceae bacterium]|nr:efflux RND transporter periplasmic adaptor subunit [Ktedonobacteraceae bacterium]